MIFMIFESKFLTNQSDINNFSEFSLFMKFIEIIKTFQRWFKIKFISLDRVMKFVVGHSEKSNHRSGIHGPGHRPVRIGLRDFQNFVGHGPVPGFEISVRDKPVLVRGSLSGNWVFFVQNKVYDLWLLWTSKYQFSPSKFQIMSNNDSLIMLSGHRNKFHQLPESR